MLPDAKASKRRRFQRRATGEPRPRSAQAHRQKLT